MSGTAAGAQKAKKTIETKYGKDYWARNGALGGRAGHTGGFWHRKYVRGDIDFIREAGRKGGTISRRNAKKPHAELDFKIAGEKQAKKDELYRTLTTAHPDPLEGLEATHVEIKKKWYRFW